MATHFGRLRKMRCLPVVESGSLSVLQLPSHSPLFKLPAFKPFDACTGMNRGINFFNQERL